MEIFADGGSKKTKPNKPNTKTEHRIKDTEYRRQKTEYGAAMPRAQKSDIGGQTTMDDSSLVTHPSSFLSSVPG